MNKIIVNTPKAADNGIILGAYISVGTLIFTTNGNHIVEYITKHILIVKQIIAKVNAIPCTLLS